MLSRLNCFLALALLLTGCAPVLNLANSAYDFCPSSTDTSHQYFGSPDADDLVVFIHGLCGDAKTTWTNTTTHFVFPEELARDFAKENQPAYVVAFDYVSRLQGGPSILSIADHLEFEIGELLKKHPYRTLRIVAHSMGGLVAREYILRHQARAHPQLKVTNVVLLATPSNGSELAKLGRLIPENRQVEELRHIDKGNTYLESLNKDWNREFKGGGHPRLVLLYAGYEELDMPWLGKIVTLSSAVPYADESMGFQQDHVSIAKPKERNDLYRWVKAMLGESLEKIARQLLNGMVQQGLLAAADVPQRLPRTVELLEGLQALAGSELEKVLTYVKAGQFQAALALLAESESKESQLIENIAQRRFTQGEIHELQFQMAQATSKYAEAVRLSPSDLKYRLWYGEILRHTGDARGAIVQFEEALGLSRRNGNSFGEAAALDGLGLAHSALSQYPKAIGYLELALVINHKSGNLPGESAVMADLGVAYSALGQYSKTIEYLEQARAIDLAIGNLRGEASVLNNLGATYRAMGQYPKAIEYHEQALAIHRKSDNLRGEGAALVNLGVAYGAMGQYSKAIEYLSQALVIHTQIGDLENEGSALSNLGTAYVALKQYPKGIEYLERALVINRKIGGLKHERNALNNLGVAYIALGQYPKAIKYLEQALAIDLAIGDLQSEGSTLGNLGIVYSALGDYTKAIEYFEQSRVIYEDRLNVVFPLKSELDALKHRKLN
jgi:tetratricopeptide (TPR) repeat protein